MITTNNLHCIICTTEAPVLKPLNSMVAEILLELFENFAKCMKWKIEKNGFDFNHDPFPFCQKCKLILVELYNLSEDMDRILTQIKTITTNAAVKIVLSNLKNNELIIDDKNLGEDETDGLSRIRKLEYFRKQTFNAYSPNVTLKINETTDYESNLKERKPQEDKVNDESVGLTFPEAISPASIEDDQIESAPVDNLELHTRLPSWADLIHDSNNSGGASWDNLKHKLKAGPSKKAVLILQDGLCKNKIMNKSKNKKKRSRFRCTKCGRECGSKTGLKMHQLVICEKYRRENPLIKINDYTFSYGGRPLFKINDGYGCGICGSTFISMECTQFHIRKFHTGTNDSRTNEDPVTDIKPPRWELSCLLIVQKK